MAKFNLPRARSLVSNHELAVHYSCARTQEPGPTACGIVLVWPAPLKPDEWVYGRFIPLNAYISLLPTAVDCKKCRKTEEFSQALIRYELGEYSTADDWLELNEVD